MATAPLDRANRWVAAVLRWGSLVSAALMLLGVLWVLLPSDFPLQVGPPPPLASLAAQLRQGNPYAVMQLGILFLLMTPLLRIVVAAGSFWRAGERRYTLVSLAVLAIIAVSLLLARSGG